MSKKSEKFHALLSHPELKAAIASTRVGRELETLGDVIRMDFSGQSVTVITCDVAYNLQYAEALADFSGEDRSLFLDRRSVAAALALGSDKDGKIGLVADDKFVQWSNGSRSLKTSHLPSMEEVYPVLPDSEDWPHAELTGNRLTSFLKESMGLLGCNGGPSDDVKPENHLSLKISGGKLIVSVYGLGCASQFIDDCDATEDSDMVVFPSSILKLIDSKGIEEIAISSGLVEFKAGAGGLIHRTVESDVVFHDMFGMIDPFVYFDVDHEELSSAANVLHEVTKGQFDNAIICVSDDAHAMFYADWAEFSSPLGAKNVVGRKGFYYLLPAAFVKWLAANRFVKFTFNVKGSYGYVKEEGYVDGNGLDHEAKSIFLAMTRKPIFEPPARFVFDCKPYNPPHVHENKDEPEQKDEDEEILDEILDGIEEVKDDEEG